MWPLQMPPSSQTSYRTSIGRLACTSKRTLTWLERGCVRETTWAQASSDEATMLLLKSGMSSWMRDRGLVVLWYDILQWGCLRLRSTSLWADMRMTWPALRLQRISQSLARSIANRQTVFELLWKAALFNSILRKGLFYCVLRVETPWRTTKRLALEHGRRQNTLVCRQSTLERFARLKAQPKRNVVRVARLRRPPLLSTLRFSAVKLPNVSRCLCSRQRSWAPCWQHSRLHLSMLMTFTIWRSSSVHWHDAFWAQCLCVWRWPYRQETGSCSDPSSRSLPSSCDPATAKAAEVASEATHLGAVHGTSVPTPCSSLRHLSRGLSLQ